MLRPRTRSLLRLAVFVLVIAAAALAPAPPARAHGIGTSTLKLRVDGALIDGDWTLNLHDARMAIGLDKTLSGEPAWRELQAHEAELRAAVTRSFSIRTDSLDCRFELAPTPMTWDRTFDYVRFEIVGSCPIAPTRLTLHDELLFDLDPTHRGYFSVEDARALNVGVFRAHERTVTFSIRQFHFFEVALEFVRDGVSHIWGGLDHLLFLLALLLPAALVREGHEWRPRAGFWPSAREVLKVVTAFTVAHSITLCLGFFGIIRLPETWIETGIAASVFAAAWNNLRPFLPGRAWAMAFGFGLVHGLGFAGALANLALPQRARGVALASFNVGVELGQVAIVLVVLPLLYAASRRAWYPRFVMGAGSLAIAWLAVVWVLQRGFSLSLFSRP
jgi:hypothetical protein